MDGKISVGDGDGDLRGLGVDEAEGLRRNSLREDDKGFCVATGEYNVVQKATNRRYKGMRDAEDEGERGLVRSIIYLLQGRSRGRPRGHLDNP